MRFATLFSTAEQSRAAQLAHALRTVPLFRDLPADDLVAIWRRLREEEFSAGSVIIRRGDPGDRFYVVKSGRVEVSLGIGPDAITIRRLVAGDAFGEMALLTGAPRNADLVVAEDAVLWALEREDFLAITAGSVPLLQAINRDLCNRLTQATNQIEDLEERLGRRGAGVAGMRIGPYRVVEQIGAGGMAVVYSAVHVETETAAAVKVLPATWSAVGDFGERLRREAAILQRLSHPNVIRVLEVGALEERAGGGCYLAMEWLPHALDRVLRAQYPEPLPFRTALNIVQQVAHGLATVHDAGVIHRDVKPSNILLRADGRPVLTDFGLALAQRDAAAARLTAPNAIMGTADYMAPEQIDGAEVDGRTDVYSLGVVLYELLAGYVPFAGKEPLQALNAHLTEAPPPLPDVVPATTRAVVERALQKDPADRYASAGELAAAAAAAAA